MRLNKITATPHPAGNRIDLTWVNPDPGRYPGVRVVRREGTYPTSPEKHLFHLDLSLQSDLDDGTLSPDLQQMFLDHQVSLSGQATAVVELRGRKWRVLDGAQEYVARKNATEIDVYDESILVADSFMFSLTLGFGRGLDKNKLSRALRQRFSDHRVALSDQAATLVELPGEKWRITDGIQQYAIRKSATALNVYDENVLVADQFLFSLALDLQSVAGDGVLSPSLRQRFSDHQVPLSDQARILVDLPGRKWRVVDGAQEYTIRKNATELDVYGDVGFAADSNLNGETVYYYALFPHQGDLSEAQPDQHNRAAAMATAPYDLAGQMYDLLPRIYHRYDTTLPEPDGVSEEDRQEGQLRRFLDLPGSQLDRLTSFARAALDLYDLDKVDGRLLPLLAQWICWETDYKQEIDAQRNEVRNAPSIYERIGIIPTVEATIKRVLGWESRVKEFVHNVCVSNQPERLNIWARQRQGDNGWSEPTEPLSLDFAYEGRPSAVRDQDGVLWLFYHTPRNERWDIWYKTLSAFDISASLQDDLEQGFISPALQDAFEAQGFALSQNATVRNQDDEWLIADMDNGETFTASLEGSRLNVRRWAPSQHLTNRASIDKHPTVAVQGATLYVFWDSYDEALHTWRVNYCTNNGGEWSTIEVFGDEETERKTPAVVVDHTGSLWLFWLEKEASRWRLKYNRRSGQTWDLGLTHRFPLDDGQDPWVATDLYAFFQPADALPDSTPRLWVFWARKTPTAQPKQTRWEIAYRAATNIDPSELTLMRSWSAEYPDHRTVDLTVTPPDLHFRTWHANRPPDWSAVYTLPMEEPRDYHDREPAACVNADGQVELFWSSNRDRSWSIWRSALLGVEPPSWGEAEQITGLPYSQSAPFPIPGAARSWLIYRSNESLSYASTVYGATQTTDFRYAGSTSVDARNVAKTALWGLYQDFQTYTYDTGKKGVRTNVNWYARDTVGIYLSSETQEQQHIILNRILIRNVLRQFLPIQVRVVFIIAIVSGELVYTYDFPQEPKLLIGEQVFDSVIPETYPGVKDDHYRDTALGWVWVHAWSEDYSDHRSVDLDSMNTNFEPGTLA